MNIELELNKEEVKTAIQLDLQDRGYDVDKEDIHFEVTSGMSGNDPREPSGPRFLRVRCENVEEKSEL